MDYGCNSRRCRGRRNGLNNFRLRRELHSSVYPMMGDALLLRSTIDHAIECLSQDLSIEVSMNSDDLTPTHPDYVYSRVHIVAPINSCVSVRPLRNRSGIPRKARYRY